MAKISEILESANSIDVMFSEFIRKARKEKLVAKFKGDTATFDRIDQAVRDASDVKEEMLAILEHALLSTDVVDLVLKELNAQKDEAQKILEKLKRVEDKLKTIQKFASLALSFVGRLKAIPGV